MPGALIGSVLGATAGWLWPAVRLREDWLTGVHPQQVGDIELLYAEQGLHDPLGLLGVRVSDQFRQQLA